MILADFVSGENGPLTTGTNSGSDYTGGDANDTFDGGLNSSGQQTLQSADSLNGGDGTDSLTATISGTGTYAPTLTSIETVDATFTGHGGGTLNLLNAASLTSLSSDSSTAAASFSNIRSVSAVSLSVSNTTSNTTFGYASGATSGSSDNVALSLDNVTNDAVITLAGIETVTISSTGSSSDINLAASSATTINASGSAALSLDSLSDDGATKVTKVDGSSMTAELTASAAGLGSATSTITLTGGSANDTLTGNLDTLTDFTAGTDEIVLDKSDFILADAAGALLAASYYERAAGSMTAGTAYGVTVLTGAGYTGIGTAEDAVAGQSTSTSTGFIIYYDTTVGYARMYYDADIGADGNLTSTSLVANFTNITTLAGLADFSVADFTIIA